MANLAIFKRDVEIFLANDGKYCELLNFLKTTSTESPKGKIKLLELTKLRELS